MAKAQRIEPVRSGQGAEGEFKKPSELGSEQVYAEWENGGEDYGNNSMKGNMTTEAIQKTNGVTILKITSSGEASYRGEAELRNGSKYHFQIERGKVRFLYRRDDSGGFKQNMAHKAPVTAGGILAAALPLMPEALSRYEEAERAEQAERVRQQEANLNDPIYMICVRFYEISNYSDGEMKAKLATLSPADLETLRVILAKI